MWVFLFDIGMVFLEDIILKCMKIVGSPFWHWNGISKRSIFLERRLWGLSQARSNGGKRDGFPPKKPCPCPSEKISEVTWLISHIVAYKPDSIDYTD